VTRATRPPKRSRSGTPRSGLVRKLGSVRWFRVAPIEVLRRGAREWCGVGIE
jgi:hypothetical protein